ncbi:peroxidase family protein [Isosphaeraceae bacterium EP7]
MSVAVEGEEHVLRLIRGFRSAIKSLGLSNVIESIILTRFGPLWAVIQRVKPLRAYANKTLIDRAICKIPPRPHALSTLADYTSWSSLTDRTYSARHLPPAPKGGAALPASREVAELFRRPAGAMKMGKSSVLFTYFAQWFTDGFLRTDYSNPLKNTSNHDIDLSNLYGLDAASTRALRSHSGGKLSSQWINGEEYPPDFYKDGVEDPAFKDLRMAALLRALTMMAGGPEASPRPASTPVGGDHPGSRPADASSRATLFSGFRDVLARKPIDPRMFAMGGDRTNSQAGFTALNVLFLREHNRVCDVLAAAYPAWDDERLFQTARNILIGVLSKIVIGEYINHITPYNFQFYLQPGAFEGCRWYRQNWMTVEFNLLYRWHGLTPDSYSIGGRDYSLKETLFNNEILVSRGLKPMLADASAQQAGQIGLRNTPELLLPVEQGSIELGRAARLRSYNDYRVMCRLPRARGFDQISADPQTQQALKDLYGTVDRVEYYPGIFAENTVSGAVLSFVIGRLVGVDAFSQALTNPLLSGRLYNAETFTRKGVEIIESTSTLADVLERNTLTSSDTRKITMTFDSRASAPARA